MKDSNEHLRLTEDIDVFKLQPTATKTFSSSVLQAFMKGL